MYACSQLQQISNMWKKNRLRSSISLQHLYLFHRFTPFFLSLKLFSLLLRLPKMQHRCKEQGQHFCLGFKSSNWIYNLIYTTQFSHHKINPSCLGTCWDKHFYHHKSSFINFISFFFWQNKFDFIFLNPNQYILLFHQVNKGVNMFKHFIYNRITGLQHIGSVCRSKKEKST
jgi:hypothetical protein